MRILLAEDERTLARQVASALTRQDHVVTVRRDGAEALAAALADQPDLVVLDLGLPTLDGHGVLARLRAEHCPSRVLILTARGDVEERVRGLRAGADDYLAKPFAIEELIARVEALGRRAAAPTATDLLSVGDLHMDVHHRRVHRGEHAISLTPREFELLHVFMQEPGRVFSRAELCARVWQRDYAYDTRTVEIFITRLRKKIDLPGLTPLVHTQRSLGYCVKQE